MIPTDSPVLWKLISWTSKIRYFYLFICHSSNQESLGNLNVPINILLDIF